MNRMFLLSALTGLCFLTLRCSLSAQEKDNALPDRAATLLRKAGQHAESREVLEAEKVYLEAAKVLEQQMADKNTDAIILSWCRCRIELGEVQFSLLKIPEAKASLTNAMAYLQQLIPLRPKESVFRFEFAKMHYSLSKGYLGIKRYVEAETHQREAVELLKNLAQEFPKQASFRLELSSWQVSHSQRLEFLGRYSEAEASYKEALRLAETLVAEAPKSPANAHQLAVTYNAYAYLVRESGRYADAIALIRLSIRILAKLEADYPDRPEYWFPLPICYRNLAQPLGYSNNETEVATAKREAARLEAKLAKIPEAARKWVTDLDKVLGSVASGDTQRLMSQQQELENLSKQAAKNALADSSAAHVLSNAAAAKGFRGLQLLARGLKDEGTKELREGMAIAQKLAEQYPDIPSFRIAYSEWYFSYCLAHRMEGDLDGDRNQGHKMILQWIAMHEKLADDYSKAPEIRFHMTEKLASLSMAFGNGKEFKEASRYLKLGHEVLKKLATDFPSCPKYRRHYADGFSHYAICANLLGAHAEAEAASREGIRQWLQMIADFPGVLDYRHSLAMNYQAFGQRLAGRKNYQAAEEAFREMVRIDEQLLKENEKDAQIHFDLSRGYRSIGIMRERQERAGDAVESYTQAITRLETAFSLNPRQRAWLAELHATIRNRADIHLKERRHEEYLRDSQRLKGLDEALDAPFFRLHRIDDRATKGETTAALKEADDLFQNIDLTGTQWRDLAVFYTNMAAKATDAAQKEALAGRAVASLRNAVEQGHARAGLADDKRFQSLAHREDFRKLILTK